jgi:hypothetical protein
MIPGIPESPGTVVAVVGDTLIIDAGDRLVRCRPDRAVLDELRYPGSMIGAQVEELVLAPSNRLLATFLSSGQGECGYDVYSIDGPLQRLSNRGSETNPMTLGPAQVLPVFSPDERLLACASGLRTIGGDWWTPDQEDWPDEVEDEALIPATGGPTALGTLVLHDIATDTATVHPLVCDLPAGWVPEDPWDEQWSYGPTRLEFTADDVLRIGLADGSSADVRLPLPDVVTVPAPRPVLADAGDG